MSYGVPNIFGQSCLIKKIVQRREHTGMYRLRLLGLHKSSSLKHLETVLIERSMP